MTSDEMERFNLGLPPLFPTLRERLRERYGRELDAWLERGQSPAIIVRETTEPHYAPFIDDDDIQESASELYYLDLEGYDGFHPAKPLSPEDVEGIRQQVKAAVAQQMQTSGLKALIQEVVSGYYDDRVDDKEQAAFFIWAAMIEDGQSQPVADLWILEQSPDFHDYMFLLEEGASFNQAWRLCVELLPPEVAAVLELEWLDLEEAA
jgi:hypothetical protein